MRRAMVPSITTETIPILLVGALLHLDATRAGWAAKAAG
jgi:hypothetical protein